MYRTYPTMVGMRRILKIPHDKHTLLKARIDKGLIPKEAESTFREMLEIVTLNPPLSKQSDLMQYEEMRAQKQKSFVKKMGMPKSMRRTYMKLLKKGKVQIPPEFAGPTKTERLVKDYMKKYEEKHSESINEDDGSDVHKLMKEEQKKNQVLMGNYLNTGNTQYESATFFNSSTISSLSNASTTSNPELLKSKSIVLSNAYEFALKQLEYQAVNPEVSEEESYKAVEELLLREDKEERMRSREVRENVVKEREEKKKQERDAEKKMMDALNNDEFDNKPENTIPSVLHNKPRIALQLAAWGDRLRQVPYKDWTIGAITALDHWIATNVLEISDENWEKMLAGEDVGSRVRDLLVVRGTLFPETLQDEPSAISDEDSEDVSMQSINQILQELSNNEDGSTIDDDDAPFSFDDDDEDILLPESAKRDDLKLKLTQELQVYRTMNQKSPYDTWSDEDKQKFDTFFDDYIAFFVMPHERKYLDFEETKQKLLNMAPNTKEESDKFWKHLEDETTIELFLDELSKKKDIASDSSAMGEFMNLPYKEQKERLMTLSTLRPLYDEYGSEQDYDKFFESNKDILLKTIPMETLVEDAEGHITPQDAPSVLNKKGDEGKKFKLSMDQYGNDENYQRRKRMLEVWRLYKLNRAQVEEDMFKKGELGLKYAEKKEDEDDGRKKK